MEKSFSFLAVKRRLEFLWARSGTIQVSDMSNNFFLVRFAKEDDYSLAAFEGPWKIYDYYFAVSQWSPTFDEDEPIKSILTWVRLPKLPFQYFNKLAVHRIGNFIGRTVRLDLATSEGSRCRYARVCVEVDLTKPLLGKYMIEDKVLKIEYESLENVCFDCGAYGHKKEDCILVPKPNGVAVSVAGAAIPVEQEQKAEEQVIGEWMTVQRRNRKKSAKGVTHSPPTAHGSRFSALQREEAGAADSSLVPEVVVTEPAATMTAEEESQLTKLKKVLDAALESQSLAEKADPKSKGIQMSAVREALSDISNVPTGAVSFQKSKSVASADSSVDQVTGHVDLEEGLIPVKVVYQNPAFQSQLSVPKASKNKTKANHRSVGVKAKDPNLIPDLLGQKKRTFKKNVSSPSLKVAVPVQVDQCGNHAGNTRKPPDRS
ncbi:hypothetical protein LINPERHAP1_LOCUS6180 [Linum perenne]